MRRLLYKQGILLPFLLLKMLFAYAQNSKTPYSRQVKWTPLKAIDLVNPGLEFSVEKQHRSRWSTQLSVAWLHNFIHSTPFTNYKGYSIGIEEKRFLKVSGRNAALDLDISDFGRPYIAAQFVYYKSAYNDVARFGVESRSDDSVAYLNNYSDSFAVAKQMVSLNFKAGFQYNLSKRLIFDISAGIGLRYKHITHFNRLIPSDKMEAPRHFNAYYMASKEGSYFIPGIPISIKLAYAF
jgi:hypothetical protein